MVSIGDLPEDVLIEILSRLSVKSLVRLKCVCKFWYALITNPYFITTHLNRASSNTHNARILLRHRLNNNAAVSIFRYKSQGLCVDAQRIPWLDKGYLMSLHGPCDGIICVYRLLCGRPISLWNPATREFRALPRFSIAGPAGANDLSLIGFGLDIRKKDYKVVRIIDFRNTETSNWVVHPTQVEVYNLSSDSWRQIHTVVPASHLAIHCRSYSAYLDGFYYWWAGEYGVLSFDIDNEVFHEIPPPPNMGYYYDVVLVKCNGSITVILDNRENSEEPVFHIWVMNGNGVEKTWTKRSTIQHPVDLSPLGLLKSGEVLLYHKEEAWVASYDPRTQKLGILQFPLDALRICCQVCFYTESLVSIKGRNKAGLERIFSLIESFFEWLF